MTDSEKKLRSQDSSHSTHSTITSGQNPCRSSIKFETAHRSFQTLPHVTNSTCSEYYKNYEHDELPVKERSTSSEATGDSDRKSLTNSQLDKLEDEHLQNCEDLKSDNISKRSLDSNLKFFKTTVAQIFDSFYSSMRDFEIYKKRFNEILAKNHNSTAEMEEFIKDILSHMSFESTNASSEGTHTEKEANEIDDSMLTKTVSSKLLEDLSSVVEAYRNETQVSECAGNDTTGILENHLRKNGELINIFLLSSTPLIQIKMNNNRKIHSEINISHSSNSEDYSSSASAEDLKKVNAKKLLMENMYNDQGDNQLPENDIPVKTSSAKNNIFEVNNRITEKDEKIEDDNKSFVSKLCNYICRRFRKSTIG